MPYAMVSRYNSHNQTALIYLEAAYKSGHAQLVTKLKTAIRKDLNDQKAYYDYLKNEKEDFYNSVVREAEINEFMIQLLDTVEKQYGAPPVQVQENPRQAVDSSQRN
jgi:DNA-binding phage protein